MTKTKIAAVMMSALMMGSVLVGCGSEPAEDQDIDTGIVVERSRRVVVVLEDDGEREKHSIHKRSRKCPVGSRWPDCKR